MPVVRCSNGKYRIGSGPCVYETKENAERAYRAYLAATHKAGCCTLFPRTAIEHPAVGGLIATNNVVNFAGIDLAAVFTSSPGEQVAGPAVFLVGQGDKIDVVPRFGPVDKLRDDARDLSAKLGEPVALAETIKTGEQNGNHVTVLAARWLYSPHNRETLIDEAHKAFPEALRRLAEYAPVQKELDPLDPRYFDRVAAMLSNYMNRDFSRISKPVFDNWINGLINRHWAEATDAELQLLTQQFNKSFRELSGRHWVNIRGQVYQRTEGLGQAVKRATVKRYDVTISPNLALKDVGAIRQMTASHAHYVTDAMGNMSVSASQQARHIVRNGLSKGLGSKEIGAELQIALSATLKGRTRAYFDMAAIAMLNRAQTYSKAVTYSEAGVRKLIWDSVLDEITTRTCFASGTMVTTDKGEVPIEQIEPGDRVLTGSGNYRTVRAVSLRWSRGWQIVHAGSIRPLTVTNKHPIMTDHGWKEAKNLEVGQCLAVSELRPRLRKDRAPHDLLQPGMQGGLQTQAGEFQARSQVQAVRQGVQEQSQDKQNVQPGMHQRGQKEAGGLDRNNLQALRKEVQGPDGLPGARAIPVLQHVMPAEGQIARGGSQGPRQGLRGLRPGVQDQFHGSPCREDPAALFQEMQSPQIREDLFMVRRRIRSDQIPCSRVQILFQGLLHEGEGEISAGDVGGCDTEGVRDRVHRRIHNRPVLSRLRLSETDDCDRGRRGLLAHAEAPGEDRREKGSGDPGSRPCADSDTNQGFERGLREGTVAEYLSHNPRREPITRVKRRQLDRPEPAYNLEVDGDPTYFANGVLVHNCRFCDSKVFSVRAVLGAFAKTAALTNPQDVKFTQPWMRERKIKSGRFKGKVGLFLRGKDGVDRMVAAELESGMGTVNNRGKWHPAMDIETLEDQGFSAPPGHGGCRSTVSPDLIPPKTRTRRVTVPASKPLTPLVDPLGAKGPVALSNAASSLAYYEQLRLEQAERAAEAGRKPPAKSKYDKVVAWSERQKTPPVFSTPNPDSLALVDAKELAAKRAVAIMLAAVPEALSQLREVRLDSKIKPADALSKVAYNENDRVLTISKAAAQDPTDAGKYTTGKQLAYALELERRRQKHKDKQITPADRAAARTTDLVTGAGTLFDPELLEEVQ